MESLIDRIVEEVLVRIDQKNESEKSALLVYTGGSFGRPNGIKAAENMKRGGWKTEIVVTEAARQIGTLDLLPEGARALGDNFASAKLLATDYEQILVPVMTISTATKIAQMIWDTPASYLIGSALSKGKQVLIARDACDFSMRDHAPVAMQKASLKTIDTLESFGVHWCKSEDLYRNLVFATAASIREAAVKSHTMQARGAAIVMIDKRIVTRGDLMPYLSSCNRIELKQGAKLTALAEDELKKNRIQWIWVDGGMK